MSSLNDSQILGRYRTGAAVGVQASPSLAGTEVGPDVARVPGLRQDRDGVNGETQDQYISTFASGAAAAAIGSDSVYEARAANFEAIDLVPGTPGVTTLLTSGDDRAISVKLGGSFNFYGTTYTTAYVSTNGLITFGSGQASASNTNLASSPTQRSIAPLWDDWVGTNGNATLLARAADRNGDGAADRMILEWNKVQGFSSSPSNLTFQVILQLNTGSAPGEIVFNYPDLDAGNSRTNGGSATVGIKDSGTQGTRRLLVSYNSGTSPYVGSGKAIRFTAKSPQAPTAPAAPSNLSASVVSSSRIDLRWSDNASDEAGYRIERSPDGATWAQAGSVGANVTSFSNTGLAAGTTYHYRVLALGTEVNSAPSAVAKATTSATTSSPSDDPLSAVERRILELVNIERQKAGQAALTLNTKLVQAARLHAGQMVTYGVMAHTISEAQYPTPADRLRAVGYGWRAYGENIAYGYADADSVMAGWMNSSGHRANILGANYTEIGVGVAYNSAGRPYYTQVFGRPA